MSFKYELKRLDTGEVTHAKVLPNSGATPWPEIPKGWGLERNFEVVETDITAEEDAREAAKLKRKTDLADVKSRIPQIISGNEAARSIDDIRAILDDVLKYIQTKEL